MNSPALLAALAGAAALPLVLGLEAPSRSPEPGAPAAAASSDVAHDSPRSALTEYLDLCRAGRYDEAARFLSLRDADRGRAAVLARRLKAVLDRHLWVDLDLVSARPEGDSGDGLPDGTDQVGVIALSGGPPQAVRLVRRADRALPRWRFSPGTVARIDTWYATLPDRWIRERLPDVLLRPGPRELLWWQWLTLVALAPLGWSLGRLLSGLTFRVAGRAAARTETLWDDAVLRRLRGPLALVWTLALIAVVVPALGLYAPAEAFLARVLKTGAVAVGFWVLWRIVDVAGEALRQSRWGQASASARSLVFVGARFAKLGVAALGILAALGELGYPVAGLLAGLGLGGLALALAAQKTVENLFGSLSLALDRPFAVGDFVRVEEFVGTVEAIGLRSTAFRTLDRTLITIPNGRLADMRLESFSARDRMRLACTIGLVYGTTAAQVRAVLAGLEGVLRGHPKIWPDAVVVRFREFAASSLDIEVMAWFATSDWSEFQLMRQEVLLQFMEVVEQAGTSFAFPTRTVHLVSAPADAAPDRDR
ncbi:MAG: mechanosensitive ion channel family protein [Acidobacteria bacterium]|nr:mechanosensitive ion channel family protein [Acidobacteriota bacterium]